MSAGISAMEMQEKLHLDISRLTEAAFAAFLLYFECDFLAFMSAIFLHFEFCTRVKMNLYLWSSPDRERVAGS